MGQRVDKVLEPADVPGNGIVLPAMDINEEQRTLRLLDASEGLRHDPIHQTA